ncbi:hypothetical protein [Arenibacterium halophilum]|jgi:hypothetical protein|uniref:Uncharacterized protein n=1 Tax=Arenibacterium halophilum TaxID=2583821 RepID=A0ABY2XB24_9RHOB|nr:hypothetical protein [Arenibacterium halophilum]MAY88939.1 hypothetical protein [Pseudooceanicola sp.]TMV13255.1 hypothetical protein FGK64_10890 [Arenibacterium halophilum]|tara:strand:- start:1897 stop:2091 length:195 start_codon:yes stop_codon:yes gene_type:complete
MSYQSNTTSSAGTTGLAFILGGVVVALGVVVWLAFGNGLPSSDQPDIRIELPGGQAIEGEVSGN